MYEGFKLETKKLIKSKAGVVRICLSLFGLSLFGSDLVLPNDHN